MSDSRYEDGTERPLALRAVSGDDVAIISALVQDAVLPGTEMRYDRRRHRFAALVNRFRWEDRDAAERQRRGYERVQSLLVVEDVISVATNGLGGRAPDLVLSLLSLEWTPEDDGAGTLLLTLSGDGQIRLMVECLDVTLRDVTRPYLAVSKKAPVHPTED